ncbi:Polypyrimidine tract-binding protein 3 [Bagarius yarrelli]|uniref:Polypyrimidine tract-binding protein 3 n=1 Tax=Bagarius yarrelli TaxID=175774 RepID=A0A556VWU2_BAGYA|nr:Polypyrimidine tract-binding protein 3 [Bagarius yarrelli]
MASEEAAVTMVNYYTAATPHVRNQPVYIQYSNHRELKTDNLPNQGRRATAASGMMSQSPVLRIIVENLFYPVFSGGSSSDQILLKHRSDPPQTRDQFPPQHEISSSSNTEIRSSLKHEIQFLLKPRSVPPPQTRSVPPQTRDQLLNSIHEITFLLIKHELGSLLNTRSDSPQTLRSNRSESSQTRDQFLPNTRSVPPQTRDQFLLKNRDQFLPQTRDQSSSTRDQIPPQTRNRSDHNTRFLIKHELGSALNTRSDSPSNTRSDPPNKHEIRSSSNTRSVPPQTRDQFLLKHEISSSSKHEISFLSNRDQFLLKHEISSSQTQIETEISSSSNTRSVPPQTRDPFLLLKHEISSSSNTRSVSSNTRSSDPPQTRDRSSSNTRSDPPQTRQIRESDPPQTRDIFSKFGTVLKIITFTKNNQFQALLQYADPINAHHAKVAMPGTLGPLAIPTSAVTGRMAIHGMPPTALHSVLLASNLNPDMFFLSCFMNLYSQGRVLDRVYGDVHRVKILFNKKENALVQMADATQAQLAMSHLNGQRLYGRILRVTVSKHQTMALIQLGSVEEAIQALIDLHNYDLGENHHLRVSFSKSTI